MTSNSISEGTSDRRKPAQKASVPDLTKLLCFYGQVKAVFPGHGLEMVAQVYASPEVGCLVVELTRRAGDAFKYNEFRESLAKELGSIVSSAADVVAMASKCVLRFCGVDATWSFVEGVEDKRALRNHSISSNMPTAAEFR